MRNQLRIIVMIFLIVPALSFGQQEEHIQKEMSMELASKVLSQKDKLGEKWDEKFLKNSDIVTLIEERLENIEMEKRPQRGAQRDNNQRPPKGKEGRERPTPEMISKMLTPKIEEVLSDKEFLKAIEEIISKASKEEEVDKESISCIPQNFSEHNKSVKNITDLQSQVNLSLKEALKDPALRKELISSIKNELTDEEKKQLLPEDIKKEDPKKVSYTKKKEEDKIKKEDKEERRPRPSSTSSTTAKTQNRPSNTNQTNHLGSMYSQNPYSMNQRSGQNSSQSSNGYGNFTMGTNPLSSGSSMYGNNTGYSTMGSNSMYGNNTGYSIMGSNSMYGNNTGYSMMGSNSMYGNNTGYSMAGQSSMYGSSTGSMIGGNPMMGPPPFRQN